MVFEAEPIDAEDPRPDGSETSDARFVSSDELSDLPVENWCKQLAERAIAGQLRALDSVENPYDLPGWA